LGAKGSEVAGKGEPPKVQTGRESTDVERMGRGQEK